MGVGFSELLGGDKPLIKVRFVFINRSNDVVVGEDGVDSGSASSDTDTEYRSVVGCVQWRQKEKMRTPMVAENENVEN
jgi:hypothetical protein